MHQNIIVINTSATYEKNITNFCNNKDGNHIFPKRVIEFIPNKWHEYKDNNEVVELIKNYIIDPKLHPRDDLNDRICIIKSSLSSNNSESGIISDNYINLFSSEYHLSYLNPSKTNEICLINNEICLCIMYYHLNINFYYDIINNN